MSGSSIIVEILRWRRRWQALSEQQQQQHSSQGTAPPPVQSPGAVNSTPQGPNVNQQNVETFGGS